jgi:hypothetical protein
MLLSYHCQNAQGTDGPIRNLPTRIEPTRLSENCWQWVRVSASKSAKIHPLLFDVRSTVKSDSSPLPSFLPESAVGVRRYLKMHELLTRSAASVGQRTK